MRLTLCQHLWVRTQFRENIKAGKTTISIYVIDEMLPAVANEKLAVFNDVFCEVGVFTPEQSERVLEAGKKYGLIPKIHADEIEPYGGAELAAKVGAISAEHLLKASDKGIKAMADAGTIACLLPATALFLREQAAEGRK